LAEIAGETFFMLDPGQEQAMHDAFETLWAKWEKEGPSWPASVRKVLGTTGEMLLNALLSIAAPGRPSAAQVAEHTFLHPLRMVSVSCRQSDRLGLLGFPAAGSSGQLLPGDRHPYRVLVGHLGVEMVEWLRADYTGEVMEALDIDFDSSHDRPNVKVECGCKWILGGKMSDTVGSKAMCTLKIDKDLPFRRVRVFWEAFRQVNQNILLDMHKAARDMSAIAPPEGEMRNNGHFLEQTADAWFCSAGEACFSLAKGSWQEEEHMDGGASILHAGITVYGDRDLLCYEPAMNPNPDQRDPFVVRNTPGTVYLGTLTGPWHGVRHTPSQADQLLGDMSLSHMLRTTLFPHDRSRVKGTTPAPQGWFHRLHSIFSQFLDRPWRLPTLSECESVDAALGKEIAMPPVPWEPTGRRSKAKPKAKPQAKSKANPAEANAKATPPLKKLKR
jgi:hypothetical protein